MITKDALQFIKSLQTTRERYFALLEEVKKNKYWLPIFTNVCSYNEVKSMFYDELMEVNKISEAKLEKQILELILSK
ncbi:DUF1322 family protein (plasmid) [Borrelia coriaceae]|uniref:Uncharacterized protein n=1 Tax=Borrelia coriaceae ATCC 43381 TaxID=1408429 RepID=W5SYM3_9SPIR|nr:DUF1322 family protein [Borrelia coriaceae]AHH11500.1 Hypothetical protein BCO_0009100 [Borrelia coriaceae ATCC 43381]AHH11950.1 Hypothetical protein BCO_0009102 [Borrelia coriaceae ATCC 43381]AHH11970.1 Hypothetical protein BCO_0009103 [Borrelia coriaceae ATCC 43381]UPA16709.1 DUF1322 family protein [Borrelia coriaceae]UPA16751.1 DUF1322 family protein [Borrelia coriaceae]